MKCVLVWYRRKDFADIINRIQSFFDVEKDSVASQRDKLKAMLHRTAIAFKVFLCLIILNVLLFTIRPFISSKKDLTFAVWLPNDQLYYYMFILQLFSSAFNAMFVVGFDIMFLSLCVHVCVQFNILQEKFKKLKRNDMEKIPALVRKHDFLNK